MKMSALLSRNASSGRVWSAPPGSIATSTGCCGASDPATSWSSTRWTSTASPPTRWSKPGVAGVVNASPSISGRYPNLGPEVLVANGITLIDDAGPEVFKKVKDGARVRLHSGGVYRRDRRLILGTERGDARNPELMMRPRADWSPTSRRSPATPSSSSAARAHC